MLFWTIEEYGKLAMAIGLNLKIDTIDVPFELHTATHRRQNARPRSGGVHGITNKALHQGNRTVVNACRPVRVPILRQFL